MLQLLKMKFNFFIFTITAYSLLPPAFISLYLSFDLCCLVFSAKTLLCWHVDNLHIVSAAGNEDQKFGVDEKTCYITLLSPLDYETKKSYTLTFRAYNFPNDTNATTKNQTITVVDVNDNAPVWNYICFTCAPLCLILVYAKMLTIAIMIIFYIF